MKKGTKVSWQIAGSGHRGCGTVIADEQDGHVMVAVDRLAGETFPGYHQVIYCTVSWLTEEAAEEVEAASEASAPAETSVTEGDAVPIGLSQS